MADVILVAIGCALGGMARFWLAGAVARRTGTAFPWGTLAVNGSGAFLIGLLAAGAAAEGWPADPALWRFLAIGFLGSYTTVSSFSLQTLGLVRDGKVLAGAGNIGLSLTLCLGGAALGLAAGAGLPWGG